ncbi:MAG: tetratricopeptide repeat protein, partial [Anaerolineae bacterium]|nr:tetratricopeptide repeat protein [Anaerolineae bacterium]
MKLSELLIEIQRALQPGEVSQVMAALRQDALIWQTVEQTDLVSKLSEKIAQVDAWRPAYLALLSLGLDTGQIDNLLDSVLSVPEDGLRNQAIQFYEETLRNGQNNKPASLAQACLLALALRERRRLTGAWIGIGKEIQLSKKESAGTWKTAFAILVDMVPDFEALAKVLLKEGSFEAAVELISNALLSTPTPPAERVNAFLDVLNNLPVSRQLSWLRLLNLRGFQTLVVQLADSLLQSDLSDRLSLDEVDLEQDDLSALLQSSLGFQQLAGLYQLSGQPEKALPLLKRSQKASQHYLAGINLQLLDVSAGEGTPEALMAVVQQSSAALPESKMLQTEYALAIDGNPHAGVLKKHLPLNSQNPFVEMQNALAASKDGDAIKAEVMARGAVADLLEWLKKDTIFSSTQFLYSWQPANFVKSLLDLNLLPEALKVTRALLKICPNNYELVELLSQLYDNMNDGANALNYSLLGLAFEANNQKTQRRVAELLETQGEYKVALDHRRKVLELEQKPQNSDWLACAACAFHSDELLQVVDACNKVIETEAENPTANSLMGQSLYRLGDVEASLPYLSQAILLSPAESQNWLMLTEIYEKNGETQKVQETLNTAILSNPESAEINYKLAQIYLGKHNLNDALPFLKKAASLMPESVQMSIQLGETLKSLGHLDEARKALEKARQKFPSDPDLALLTARTQVSMGDNKAALPALEVVMQAGKPGFDEYMMYLRALLGDHLWPLTPASTEQERAKLLSAQNALEKALAINAEDFNARVLKAEVLAAKGSKEEAFENYQALVDHPNASVPSWQWRIYGGFGKVALDLNEIETALAVLKEATHAQPENVYLQRLLADAFLVADLKDEAYQVAQNALKLAPTNLQNLAWFADMAIHLEDESEAINALKCIVELDPDSAGNWVKLADTQLKTGDVDGTRKTLKSLLSLDHLDIEHWRQAAYVFLRLNDQVSALSCLEQAIQLSPERAAELNFEVACLHKGLGNIDAALDALQKAIEISPDERILYVMQADLMADLNRNQAAMACLEQALNLQDEHTSEQVQHFEKAINQAMKLLPARWVEIANSNAGVHIRLARLLRRLGNIPDALDHAEKALESTPDMFAYRYLAVDLAKTLLMNDKARQMLDWIETYQEKTPSDEKTLDEQPAESWLSLLCQWAEQILDTDEEVLAGRIVQQLIVLAQENARVMAAQARMLVRQGQVQVAEEVMNKVKQIQGNNPVSFYDHGIFDYAGTQLVNECLKDRPLWYANALLETNNWQEALETFKNTAHSETDALVNFEYARGLVKVAEKQRLMSELKCIKHLPGEQVLTDENGKAFEKAIHLALNISNAPEAELWLLRGKVAFNPNPQNIHAFDRRLEHDGDVAPLVAALRQSNNLPSALTVAQRLRGTPEDLLEGALCL